MSDASWPGGLDGRVALVTEAASPVGYACARLLADTGARVALVDDDEQVYDRAQQLADETTPPGERREGCALGVMADLQDPQAVAGLVEEISAALGPVDVFVHVVARSPHRAAPAPLAAVSFDDWHAGFATWLDPAFLVARAVLPGMRARGWGRFVALVAPPAIAHAGLATAQRALLGFTGALAEETVGTGITANAVVPGGRSPGGGMPGQAVADGAEELIAGEVASVVAFLASTAAARLTGQTVTIGIPRGASGR
jgi:3-oxoacyl-[acyl-carrier protein] reductase